MTLSFPRYSRQAAMCRRADVRRKSVYSAPREQV
jgi:hypothetical protein